MPAIAEKVGSSLATAKRDLAALKREGKITFDGPPKSGRYRLEG
jgi:DNA-binding IclR family transcriptional regulator